MVEVKFVSTIKIKPIVRAIKNSGLFFSLLFLGKINQEKNETVFVDSPNAQRSFAAYYQSHIVPRLSDIEEKRVKAAKSLRIASILAIILGCAMTAGVLHFVSLQNLKDVNGLSAPWQVYLVFTSFGVAFFVAIIGWCVSFVNRLVAPRKADIKQTLFSQVLKFFGEGYSYSSKTLLHVRDLRESEIIPHFEIEQTKDYIKGVHNSVGFEIIETVLLNRNNHGKRVNYEVAFEGSIILIDMNKRFSGKTIGHQDVGTFGNVLLSGFAKTFGSKFQNVRLEDPVFENQFEVYSTDQVEARYLLTTSFMERLIKLREVLDVRAIEFSLYNNKLLILVPRDIDRFEIVSILRPTNFEEEIKILLAEMESIAQIIDTLKLNQRIGL